MDIEQIYIIDDDPSVASLLINFASVLNIQAEAVCSWQEVCVDRLKQADLLVLDLNMPDIDGLDVLELLNEEKVNIPIFLCSGQDDNVVDTAIDLLKSNGFVSAGKLNKPFSLLEFTQLLKDFSQSTQNNQGISGLTLISDKQSNLLNKEVLQQALKENWFSLAYQPQVYTDTKALFGFECLARLDIHKKVSVSPDVFIPSIAKYGLMDEFTLMVVELALSSLEKLDLPDDIRISFNLSTTSLTEEFLAKFVKCHKRFKFSPHNIVLEITESATLDIRDNTKKLLTKLRLQGFNLSLDDFGTGFATIQEIDALPFNEIKIDKLFVQTMATKKTAMAIVSTTIDLAIKLNFRVIAEGVETKQQADTLHALNCEVCQGYFFYRPLNIEQTTSLINELNSKCIAI